MKTTFLALFASFLLITVPVTASEAQTAHDFSFNGLDGKPINMADFSGKPVLLVNTASKCGFTPQYAGLQKLWSDYEAKGLIILGVPSGDFANQEYENSDQIAEFCEINYGVTFPLAERNVVTGDDAHALYKWLRSEMGDDSAPDWNFHKYLISADGQPVAWFDSKVKPGDAAIVGAIDEELAS